MKRITKQNLNDLANVMPVLSEQNQFENVGGTYYVSNLTYEGLGFVGNSDVIYVISPSEFENAEATGDEYAGVALMGCDIFTQQMIFAAFAFQTIGYNGGTEVVSLDNDPRPIFYDTYSGRLKFNVATSSGVWGCKAALEAELHKVRASMSGNSSSSSGGDSNSGSGGSSTAAQSTGLCEAAYREALKYAGEREQFGKPIIHFAAVAEMLKNMEAKTLASRAMLYETARFVDIYKQLNHIANEERSLEPEERQEMKFYNRLADGFTPLAKMFSSEYANEVAYDSIQIHGGSGYMKDYACERLYRDARIMNIYEGTTQLQVVAAINHVTKGTYLEQIMRYEENERTEATKAMGEKLVELRKVYEQVVARVEALDKECAGYKDFHARRLVEIAGYIILSHIMLRQAGEMEAEYLNPTKIFVKYATKKITEAAAYINESETSDVELFKA